MSVPEAIHGCDVINWERVPRTRDGAQGYYVLVITKTDSNGLPCEWATGLYFDGDPEWMRGRYFKDAHKADADFCARCNAEVPL